MSLTGSFIQRSRHGTTYFFRRRVPDDLRVALRRSQLYRSLRTTCPRQACLAARKLAYETDTLFALLRLMPTNDKEKAAQYGDLWGQWGSSPEPTGAGKDLNAPIEEEQMPGERDDGPPLLLSVPYTLQWGQDAAGNRVLTGLEVEPGNELDHRLALDALHTIQSSQTPKPQVAAGPKGQDIPVEPTRRAVAGLTVEEAAKCSWPLRTSSRRRSRTTRATRQ